MLITIAGLVSLLSGCVVAVNTDDREDEAWFSKQKHNAVEIENLELGQSERSVISTLGEPNFVESFMRHGEPFRILYYRTRHRNHDGVTTKSETTPVVFSKGTLIGWGDSAVENATAN